MPIRFRCVHCSQPVTVADGREGTSVRCPKCGRSIQAPALGLPQEVPAAGPRVPPPAAPHAPPPTAPAPPRRVAPAPPRAPSAPAPPPATPGFVPHRAASRVPYELYIALALVLLLTLLYAFLCQDGAPAAGGALGHALGIIGFVLMLSTETLYSLRKRLKRFAFGRMSVWLRAHIVTGIVGPYLVLLHTGWRFHGLAGILTLLTIVMVLSGFVGRYIYTAVPRTLDGAEVEGRELERRIAAADGEFKALGLDRQVADALAQPHAEGWRLVLTRPLWRWRQRQRLRRLVERLDASRRTAHLRELLEERLRLQMQMESLSAARRLLALWHVVHVPIGVVLFTLAFLHIAGALYFSTFLR
ncbi:MAG: hypothetical protein U0793_25165 [Gemmataceae bacterium]